MSSKITKYCLPLAIGLMSSQAFAAPSDVETIQTASDAIDSGLTLRGDEAEKRFMGIFTRMVLDRALAIGEHQGITETARLDSKDFKRFTVKWVGPQVKKAASISNVRDRREAWYDLLRVSSTDGNAHALLAAWMDFEAPASYLSKTKRGDPPRISSQLTVSSSDGRLQIHTPNVTLGGELGGAGQGNGVIDAGEWINLGLAIYNDSNLPFFSSSAWIVSGHACAWVPKAYEIELQEMPAREVQLDALGREKAPPTEALSTWIYLSETCADKAIVPLQIKVLDTHRAASTPVVMAVNLRVRNRGQAEVVDYLVDSDQPGWSDNAPLPEVDTGRVFELSHGIATSPVELMSARAAWAVRKDLGAIFKSQKPAAEPLLSSGPGRFMAGDDLDLITHDLREYDIAVQAVADDLKWDSLDDAQTWYATDTEILYQTPDPPIEAPPPPPPPEVCDNYLDDDLDGKHDCQDSDCAEEPVCNVPAPVAFKALYDIWVANASIVANPAKPTIPGAIDAVEPGYELVLDQEMLALQYQCLIDETPLSECGLIVCPECDEEEKAEKEKPVVDTGRDPAVAYVHRNYFTIPLHWNPHEGPEYKNCEDDRDNNINGDIDCDDDDCPACVEYPPDPGCRDGIDNDGDYDVDCDDLDCNDPEGIKHDRSYVHKDCRPDRFPYRRLDLNVDTGIASFTNSADVLTWKRDSYLMAPFGLRYVWGYKVTSPVRVMFAFEKSISFPLLNVPADATASVGHISVGVVPNIEKLSFKDGKVFLEPHLVVRSVRRIINPGGTVNIDTYDDRAIAVDLELELHVNLNESWGLYGGAGYEIIDPATLRNNPVMDTSGIHGEIGFSRTFPKKLTDD
jgi:hypothetical protein